MTERERLSLAFKRSREFAKEQPINSFNHDIHYFAKTKYSSLPRWEKIARSVADAIVNQEVFVDPYDGIIGRTFYEKELPIEEYDEDFNVHANRKEICARHPEYEEYCRYLLTNWGSLGHIAWNWRLILEKGTSGMKALINEKLNETTSEESKQFFKGALIMYDALEKWNDKHIEALEKMNMFEQAEICRRVPKYPARSFREAVQAFFIQHIVVMKENPHGGNSPGRLDYYLWPYLEKDLESGVITLDEAQVLVEELFFRIDERMHSWDTWGETIVVGGSHPDGTSAVTPLSYAMIRAFMNYDITHPYFYARIPENAPKDYIDLCTSYILKSKNRAQVINDKAIVSAITASGVEKSDAYNYCCGGCMEISVHGKTSDLLYTGMHAIPILLELCLTGGYSLANKTQLQHFSRAKLTDFSDFESFYSYFIAECKKALMMELEYMDLLSEALDKARPSYLLSTMLDDCIERGKTMHGGGTVYHDYGASFVGLPNTADALTAVKKAVFEEKICSSQELLEALKANFEGYEKLHSKLLSLPKYGQENAEADEIMNRVSRDICRIFCEPTNRFGGHGKPIILSFTYAPQIGKLLGASPDGRKAGVPVCQGVTPQSLAMTKGITSAMNSALNLPFDIFYGGATTMWDLDHSWVNEEIVKWLFTSFFDGGGQYFQGNVTDVEELVKAQENPSAYPNLIVRVGGYSARFVNLNKALQDEIINRTRHKG